jgi:hypothetical protein
MFGRKTVAMQPRYNITRDGHGDFRVEPLRITANRLFGENPQTRVQAQANHVWRQVFFLSKVFGNQQQAEQAIADFEQKLTLDVRQVVAQVF